MRREPGGEAKLERSLTDPDAALCASGAKDMVWSLSSGEIAVSEDHFIVAVRVTQNATDNASLLPMIEPDGGTAMRPAPAAASAGRQRIL